jgi:hypothetical protein
VRSNLIVASAACLLLMACGGNDLESLGPPPEASPTGNVSPVSPASPSPAVTGATGATGSSGATGTPTPSVSPGFTGSVDVGSASLAISGDMHITESALPLTGPTIYSPPPGPFALGWDTDSAAFALSGTSFVGNHPTSAILELTFSIGSGADATSFTSDDGGCDVIVTTAEPTTFEGTFSCTGIADEDGAIVVNAQGTFSATG